MTSNALALCMRYAAACQRLPIHPRRNHARGQQPHLCKRGAHCRPAIHFVNVVSAPGSTQPAAPCSCACSSSSSSWHASRMQGTMQHWPMTVTSILQYAARWHPEQQIVCKTVEGPTVISTYADLDTRAQLCALALKAMGMGSGDVVGTLGWNTTRHLEAWYGIMGIGAVCHTLNPRLSDAELTYIINHGQDQLVFVDFTLLPILARILKDCPRVKGVVVMTDRQHMPRGAAAAAGQLPVPLHCYEELLDAQVGGLPFVWPPLDENAPCGLCYTSGTTGNPKGVRYTHRSNFLQGCLVVTPDALCLGAGSTVLMVVPMFHANSWGLNFAGPMVGAKLVLPGPHLDGENIHQLLEQQRVTNTAGVPTVWLNLLNHMAAHKVSRFSTLHTVVIGGAAPPRSMIQAFESMGVTVRHMWGMTELGPLGSVNVPKGSQLEAGLTQEEALDYKVSQGRPHMFCDMRLVDDDGQELPRDGTAVGHLQVRGPVVVGQYHGVDTPTTDAQGWFDTGDVASLDTLGYMRITDRSKDVIKSGGEWISSITLENLAMGHPQVLEAAAIAIPDEKWTERPLLVVVLRPPTQGTDELKQQLLQYMAEHSSIAKHQLPDDVVFVPEIPHNATGKISKISLRRMFKDYQPPSKQRSRL